MKYGCFSIVLSAMALAGCATDTSNSSRTSASGKENIVATAVLAPTQGNNARGTVKFIQERSGIRVVAHIEGLTPGKHGFHVHEKGDCSAPDGSSAGGHFNPAGMQHGGPDGTMRHAGDFGNLEANAQGMAHYDRLDKMITVSGANSIMGKAVIVHGKADDLTSQPAGNAGPRVACGVIQR